MQQLRSHSLTSVFALAPFLALPAVAQAATVTNPLCSTEKVSFNPDNGSDIVVPAGFTVSGLASGLNAPTGIAFLGNSNKFQVFVLESGHRLPRNWNVQGKV